MVLKNKKILVTGGAGFIGSHLVDRLLKNDNEVIVIDDLSTGNLKNLSFASKNKNFKFIKGDIRDFELLKQILENIEIVFHEAGLANVQKSIDNPYISHDVNVNGTLKLLLASKENSIEKIIYASSSSVYGDLQTLPHKEDMKPKPISPYAITKLTCEYYLSVFYKIYGLKTTSLRYFNVYGPRQPDHQYSGVISIWFSRIVKDMPPIIFGNGLQTRDFIYVEDVVEANILAAEKKSSIGEIFNVGSGVSISVLDLAEEILKVCNKKINYELEKPRKGDIKDSLADISKIEKLLGYKPKFVIQEGLRNLYNWIIKK